MYRDRLIYYSDAMICDVIKQNESELEKTTTQFSFALYAPITGLYYAANLIKIEHTVPEIWLFQ